VRIFYPQMSQMAADGSHHRGTEGRQGSGVRVQGSGFRVGLGCGPEDLTTEGTEGTEVGGHSLTKDRKGSGFRYYPSERSRSYSSCVPIQNQKNVPS
jgi:hypothetical protein